MSTKISSIETLKEFCFIGESVDCFIKMKIGENRDKSICRLEEDLFNVIDENTGNESTLTTSELASDENMIGHAMTIGTFYTYANTI
jgi:hypothetical protein